MLTDLDIKFKLFCIQDNSYQTFNFLLKKGGGSDTRRDRKRQYAENLRKRIFLQYGKNN